MAFWFRVSDDTPQVCQPAVGILFRPSKRYAGYEVLMCFEATPGGQHTGVASLFNGVSRL